MRLSLLLVTLLGLAACSDSGATGGAGGGTAGGEHGGASAGGAGGGPAGAVRECDVDEDCVVEDDCCACGSLPSGSVQACELECEQSSCSALGLDAPLAACVFGQCVFALSCDGAMAACDQAPPTCDAGMVASVQGLCWGPCIPAAECREVATCDDCGALACMEDVGFTIAHHCIENANACPDGPTCDCLGDLCNTGSICMPGQDSDVTCTCPSC